MISKIDRLYASGQYLAASNAFLAALQDPEIDTPASLAQLYFLGAKIRHKLGNWQSALELARIAERHAIAAGNGSLLGRIWFNLVEYLRTAGDIAEATEYGSKWLTNLGMYPELERYAGACHNNMALCYRQRNDMEGCLRHNRQAADLIERAGNHPMAVIALVNLAWHSLEAGLVEEAAAALAQAKLHLTDEDLHGQRVHLLARAFYHYHTRHYEGARQICEEFVAPGAEATEEQRFWAFWMCGMMYADIGRQDLAQKFWLWANDSALKTGEPRLLNFASQLRQQFLRSTHPTVGEQ